MDGNASIEVRNNGTGTPYIDFAQTTDSDYDARLRLIAPGRLAIEGADLYTAGSVGIGSNPPKAKLHVVGDTRIDGGVTSKARYQRNDEAETAYDLSPRYHLSLTADKYDSSTKPIPKETLIDLCGDPDGCEVRMAITHYQNGGEAEVLSSSSMFYYSSDGHWRNVADHANANYVIPEYKEGVVNNGRVEVAMILRNMCHFMDGSFVKTSLLGDTGAGMALLLWESGGKYYNPKTTCELTLID